MKLTATLQVVALLICMYNLPECVSQGNESPPSVNEWLQTLGSSECKPRDTVVNVGDEYPHNTDKTYNPKCVTVKRCSGCCNGDGQICTAVETRNTTVTVSVTSVSSSSGANGVSNNLQRISLTEHTKCECIGRTTTPPPTTTREPRR
ncbi:VEGF-like protein [Orf virus]|uniref:Vascular endothelial growth factor n=1 Tax=Orf virus TaxID=10258 RepID=D3JEM6_ORFV|nr:vascular endothelial growth factor [Orf virus]ADG23047.1 vascular endothelial growth factor [Orf virus]AWN09368.1 vascular endothelial growth factor [Orf virus]WGU15092.1 VEGF-like protein [Orf virus]WGU15223.1 VEGF-like protein [Orf virus]